MFIVFAGLPGTGKSTISRELADRLEAVYLRVDSIEQAIRFSGVLGEGGDIGPAGYMAICRVAEDNLALGHTVIADSVNPIAITREAYRNVAKRTGAGFLDVEIICSDPEIHRHRVETRPTSVEGLTLPTWEEVRTRHYEAWDRPPLQLDTARLSAAECVQRIIEALPPSR